jgi:hypothetical protein
MQFTGNYPLFFLFVFLLLCERSDGVDYQLIQRRFAFYRSLGFFGFSIGRGRSVSVAVDFASAFLR